MKDALGFEVEVGCTVAYPCRQGSRCWHGKGRVLEIDEAGNSVKLTGGGTTTRFDQKTLNLLDVPKRDRWVTGGKHLVVAKGTV